MRRISVRIAPNNINNATRHTKEKKYHNRTHRYRTRQLGSVVILLTTFPKKQGNIHNIIHTVGREKSRDKRGGQQLSSGKPFGLPYTLRASKFAVGVNLLRESRNFLLKEKLDPLQKATKKGWWNTNNNCQKDKKKECAYDEIQLK